MTKVIVGARESLYDELVKTIADAADRFEGVTCVGISEVQDFLGSIDWGRVFAGVSTTIMGVIVAATAGGILLGVAPLVAPAIALLAAGTSITAALIALGTAIAAIIGTIFGISDIAEGVGILATGADYNVVRDTLFKNNPDDYYMIEMLATLGAAQGAQTIRDYRLDAQITSEYNAYVAQNAGNVGQKGNGTIEEAGKNLDNIVVPKDSDLWRQTPEQLKKSKESLINLINEHEAKLADYIKDPYAYDNKGVLKNAANDEIRNNIINGRIASLNKQIAKQKGELNKVLKVLSELGISD